MDEKARIPISVSMRHVHLTLEHVAALFGAGHRLTPLADLSQPGQFTCTETVTIVGPKGSIPRVRVLGPEREASQVEISRTDEFTLGVDAPIRPSGQIDGTPGLKLSGPAGEVALERGVIQAQRHIHMSPRDSARLGVKDKDWVMVRVGGERGIVFDDVLVRVSDNYRLDMHIDADEGNAADLHPGATGTMLREPTTIRPEPED